MMAVRQLLILLLIHTSGSVDTVFVQTGDSVQLDIQTLDLSAAFDEIFWENETSVTIVKYYYESKNVKMYTSYKSRTEFNNRTFSLTLKNMQKTDSGVYKAKITGESNRDVAEHRVFVVDAVEAPVLTVNSNWSSGNPCNFTCEADNITVISTVYNGSSCFQEVTSSDSYTLSLTCTGDTIMCNHSNPVSWKTDTRTVQLCTDNPEKRTSALKFETLHWLIPLIAILPLGLFVVVISFCVYKKNKDVQKTDTVYAEAEDRNKPQKPLEMMPGSTNIHTVYDATDKQADVTMGTSQTPATPDSINQVEPATENSKTTTIYCAIQKIPKLSSDTTIYSTVNKHAAGSESVR